jgi:hypothetical protein
VFAGYGCINAGPNSAPDAVAGEPFPPPASAIPAAPGEQKTVVFSRGCFSTKIAAQDLGYNAVIVGQSHGGTRTRLPPDAFFCGGRGHDYDEQVAAICIGHRAMHLMFNDPPAYDGPEGIDIAVGALGERYAATTEFDGWGYVQLHDATQPNLPIVDSYAVPEALDEDFAADFGAQSVHEVKTDPRPGVNLAYFSYYNAGFRVAEFGADGLTEVGSLIDQGGSDLWGVFQIGDETAGHGLRSQTGQGEGQRPHILLSDRDYGLYVVQCTGWRPEAASPASVSRHRPVPATGTGLVLAPARTRWALARRPSPSAGRGAWIAPRDRNRLGSCARGVQRRRICCRDQCPHARRATADGCPAIVRTRGLAQPRARAGPMSARVAPAKGVRAERQPWLEHVQICHRSALSAAWQRTLGGSSGPHAPSSGRWLGGCSRGAAAYGITTVVLNGSTKNGPKTVA